MIFSPINIPYITKQKLLPTNIAVINFEGFDVIYFRTLAIIPFLFFSISKKTLLQETKVREVMIPRAEIVGINKSENILKLSSLFESTGYSKIPVYDENIDDIIGFVHAFEMLKKPKLISEILLPIEYVHEPNLITEVLKK